MSAELPNPAKIALRLLVGDRVPASQVSHRTKAAFRSILTAGIVKIDSSPRGEVYAVGEPKHLRLWLEREYPIVLNRFSAAGHGAQNLILSRDTKARRRTGRTMALLFRGFSSRCLIRNGAEVPIWMLTGAHGVAAVALGPADIVSVTGPCAVVENPDLFWEFGPAFRLHESLVLFKSGRASDQMLQWMQTCADATFVLHVDFDPVGLDEYRRFKAVLAERVQLFLPTNLDALFRTFGNKQLLKKEKNVDILTSLRSESDPAIVTVLQLIDRYDAVLEHESLTIVDGGAD